MKIDSTEKQKIYDGIVSSYDICDGFVYFAIGRPSALYKMRNNGTDIIKLSDDNCVDVCVFNDNIYFSDQNDNNKIYSIKTDGTGKTKITEDRSTRINVCDDWIYYIDNFYFNINKISIDGKEKIKLNNEVSENLHVLDEWIFYNKDYGLGEGIFYPTPIMMKLDGSDNKSVHF